MKKYIFSVLAMTTLLTAGQPILALDSTSRLQIDQVSPDKLSDLNLRVNPQAGMSNFEHSKGSGSQNAIVFGTTVEAGQSQRKLETGILLMTMGSDQASAQYLTIPMMAKLRVLQAKAQSYYAKFGFAPAFEINSSNKRASNNIDVLMGAGIGGRLALTKDMDFVIEGTFNRGLMDNVKGGGSQYNQGFLLLGGLSVSI